MVFAATIAFILPFAPACATPLNVPKMVIFPPTTTSAPEFTSPQITILPAYSSLFPERTELYTYFVSEISVSTSNVFLIACNPNNSEGVSNLTSTLISETIIFFIILFSFSVNNFPVTRIGNSAFL